MYSALVLRAISSRRIDRPAVRSGFCGSGYEKVWRSSCSESVRNPSDRHTQTPQKPERAADSSTQTHRNQTTRPVHRSGYCSQDKTKTQGKFTVLLKYLLDTYTRCRSSLWFCQRGSVKTGKNKFLKNKF